MGQKASMGGLSMLDSAKAAVEHFIKIRFRDPSRMERLFLVSCGPGLSNVVVGWKDPPGKFMEELKALTAEHTSDLPSALKRAFELLNMHRLQAGVDLYGQGRKPWTANSSCIIVLTDGGVMCNLNGNIAKLDMQGGPQQNYLVSASAMTPEFYRWDERLFCVINSFPRFVGAPAEPRNDSAAAVELQKLAESTGGGAYYPTTMKLLLGAMEQIADRTQAGGVTVSFECVAPPRGLAAVSNQFVKLSAPSGVGPLWPLPEDFHATAEAVLQGPLQQSFHRAALPTVLFSASDKKLSLLPSFPVDKYELEPSPFSAFFLKTAKEGMCWPLQAKFNHAVRVVGKTGVAETREGRLVGFVKAQRAHVAVVYVLPYNFPELFGLLDELLTRGKGLASGAWKQAFDLYLRNLPFYYLAPLRAALKHLGLAHVLSDQLDGAPPLHFLQMMKKLALTARQEAERFEAVVEEDRRMELARKRACDGTSGAEAVASSGGVALPLLGVTRARLLADVDRLRALADNTVAPRYNISPRFSLPVSFMGDYHVRQSSAPPLRAPREGEEESPALFGNPFFALSKVSSRLKKDSMLWDEAEQEVQGREGSPSSPRKRTSRSGQSPTDLKRPTKIPSPQEKDRKDGPTKIPSPTEKPQVPQQPLPQPAQQLPPQQPPPQAK